MYYFFFEHAFFYKWKENLFLQSLYFYHVHCQIIFRRSGHKPERENNNFITKNKKKIKKIVLKIQSLSYYRALFLNLRK